MTIQQHNPMHRLKSIAKMVSNLAMRYTSKKGGTGAGQIALKEKST